MNKKEKILCPSAPCKEGAQVIGIRQEDGMINILSKPILVDKTFLEAVKDSEIKPERQFRFTNKCVESGCYQWNGKGCGVAMSVMEAIEKEVMDQQSIPDCSIRPRCRWHLQEGINACRACTLIITEITDEELSTYLI